MGQRQRGHELVLIDRQARDSRGLARVDGGRAGAVTEPSSDDFFLWLVHGERCAVKCRCELISGNFAVDSSGGPSLVVGASCYLSRLIPPGASPNHQLEWKIFRTWPLG